MVEKARRVEVEQRRPDAAPAWEILACNEADDPPRYVGTVRAEDAHEEAARLFCWYAHEVWVCPTDEVRKFAQVDEETNADAKAKSHEEAGSAVPDSGVEERTHEL